MWQLVESSIGYYWSLANWHFPAEKGASRIQFCFSLFDKHVAFQP